MVKKKVLLKKNKIKKRGEEKDDFWKVVDLCTNYLPDKKPRYCMVKLKKLKKMKGCR
jgi:hypothetical protein